MNKPNIIFYFTDQQRADSAGCYGQKLPVPPNLDAVAEEGTLFENAFSLIEVKLDGSVIDFKLTQFSTSFDDIDVVPSTNVNDVNEYVLIYFKCSGKHCILCIEAIDSK